MRGRGGRVTGLEGEPAVEASGGKGVLVDSSPWASPAPECLAMPRMQSPEHLQIQAGLQEGNPRDEQAAYAYCKSSGFPAHCPSAATFTLHL